MEVTGDVPDARNWFVRTVVVGDTMYMYRKGDKSLWALEMESGEWRVECRTEWSKNLGSSVLSMVYAEEYGSILWMGVSVCICVCVCGVCE